MYVPVWVLIVLVGLVGFIVTAYSIENDSAPFWRIFQQLIAAIGWLIMVIVFELAYFLAFWSQP